jgi:hypothetical protein
MEEIVGFTPADDFFEQNAQRTFPKNQRQSQDMTEIVRIFCESGGADR